MDSSDESSSLDNSPNGFDKDDNNLDNGVTPEFEREKTKRRKSAQFKSKLSFRQSVFKNKGLFKQGTDGNDMDTN